MAYFPFCIDISGKKCVIVGGGSVALRKAEKLLDFGADITVVAPKISRCFEDMPVTFIRREFAVSDIDDAFMVIYAADDKALAEDIRRVCTEKKIMLNSVDDKENCSFIFPSIVQKDNITISISTGGTSPVFAKHLKERIDELLDEHTLEIAAVMSEYRNVIKNTFTNEELRSSANEILLEMCLNLEELPSDEQIRKVLGLNR